MNTEIWQTLASFGMPQWLYLASLAVMMGVGIWQIWARPRVLARALAQRSQRRRVRSRQRLAQEELRRADLARMRRMRAALRGAETNPLWPLVLELIELQIDDASAEAVDVEKAGTPLAAYYAGAVRHLERFREFLLDEREKALEEADDEE